MTYGLFLLTAKDDRDNGCIINTAFQVAIEPFRIAISVQNNNFTKEIIEKKGEFNISVLDKNVPFETIRHFGMQTGREIDKFSNFSDVKRSFNGLLYLTENANSFFSAKVQNKIDLGSHTMFIAEVTEAQVLSKEQSCTYSHYHKEIKPKL